MKHGLFMCGLMLLAQTSLASIPQSQKKIDLDITSQWRLFITTEARSYQESLQILQTLYIYQLDHKIDSMPTISHTLLHMIHPHQIDQNITQNPYWLYAKRFDPNSPKPAYFICHKGKEVPFAQRISYCFQGLQLEIKSHEGRLFHLAYLSHVLYTTILASVFLTLCFLVAQYAPFLCQYISIPISWLYPFATGTLLTVILLTLSLTFGWVVGCMLVAWFLCNSLSKKERCIMVLLFAWIACIPHTFDAPARYIQFQQSRQRNPTLTSSKEEIIQGPKRHREEPQTRDAFTSALFRKTFYQSSPAQLYTTLVLAVFVLLVLGMFNRASDYFAIFHKRQRYTRKTILKNLHPYPVLYFKFIRTLEREDQVRSLVYFLLPPYYYYDNNQPFLGFISTLILCFFTFALWHARLFLGVLHFTWIPFWAIMLGITWIVLWLQPKKDKNADLYAKSATRKK